MSTISASTTSTTAYKVTADTTGALVFQTGASPTTALTLSSTQLMTLPNDASISGLTVGKGAGAVSFNTVVGSGALAANSTGNAVTAVGYGALAVSTVNYNTAVGRLALTATSTGVSNTGVGAQVLSSNTLGAYNTALGQDALFNNTTASRNNAVGYQAGYTNQTGQYNIFIGFQAGYSSTNSGNTLIGYGAGYTTTGTSNTFIGANSAGQGSGELVTTGSKNTIIGAYNGNQGGLDIRTATNYIVLSDGDGNPLFGYNAGGLFGWIGNSPMTASGSQASFAITGAGNGNHVSGTRNTLWLRNNNASGNQSNFFVLGSAGTTSSCIIGNDLPADGSAKNTLFVQAGGSGGVNLTSGATSWTSASDARLKNVTGTYTNALADIAQIEAVKFTWKSDEGATPQVGVIAQSVQAVVPEAIDTVRVSKEDETDYLSVKYTELIPLMIAAIQELKAEIETLKGQA